MGRPVPPPDRPAGKVDEKMVERECGTIRRRICLSAPFEGPEYQARKKRCGDLRGLAPQDRLDALVALAKELGVRVPAGTRR